VIVLRRRRGTRHAGADAASTCDGLASTRHLPTTLNAAFLARAAIRSMDMKRGRSLDPARPLTNTEIGLQCWQQAKR